MRTILTLALLSVCLISYAQSNDKTSTIDFVQVLDSNEEEAIFYYQNNWEVLRKKAVEKGYIQSYQILETTVSQDAPFQLMLITTYPNQEQYKLREEHFDELIKENGSLKLMNNKKPSEFRKTLFNKEQVKHWN